VVWPGDRESFVLGPPEDQQAVWARRMPVMAAEALQLELFPPEDADYDLIVYREDEDGLTPVAMSLSPVLGQSEFAQLDRPRMGWYVVVVRRVQGEGEAVLQTDSLADGDTRWPLRLSSRVISSPIAHDFDDDGRLEVVVVNSVAIDDQSHTFYVFQSDGSEYGAFPRVVFSPGALRGQLTSPAVADLGSGSVLVSGSEFGIVYGVHESADTVFETAVTVGDPTTAAAIWGSSSQSRVLLGVPDGVVVLDNEGAEIDRWLFTGGVHEPVALGDLDGDSVEEVVLVDGTGTLWAVEIDGTPLSGWPKTIASSGAVSAPVLVGDNGGPIRVSVVETPAGLSSRLHVVGPGGSPVPGFPRTLTATAGGSAEASGGLVASRLRRDGPVMLLTPAFHQAPQGALSARLHAFGLDGSETMFEEVPIAGPAYAGSSFLVTRAALASPRVAEVTSWGDAEVWLTTQVAWTEWDGGLRRRYGSLHASLGHVGGVPQPHLALQTLDGHLSGPPLGIVAPMIADLDGDQLADLVVARKNRLYLQSGRQPTVPADGWGIERGGGRRTACYDCVAREPVDSPSIVSSLRLALDAYPNPFNPRTTLSLTAPGAGAARWTVYDARGRQLRRWVRQLPSAGEYRETFDALDDAGRALSSGIYHVVVELGGEVARRQLTLVR
jgi:hypothetical protein